MTRFWFGFRRRRCFAGDNYYSCWTNLYAIRGGQYRDIAAWVKSLDIIRSYQVAYLLPGHIKPICGMNEEKDIDMLATEIALPEEYAGWFYGNSTHLHPLSPKQRGGWSARANGRQRRSGRLPRWRQVQMAGIIIW